LAGTGIALAKDIPSKANSAVTDIVFEYDANDFSTYAVRESGFVDVTFARNTPDALYGEILTKLKNHPDIKGVLAGKGGPGCSGF